MLKHNRLSRRLRTAAFLLLLLAPAVTAAPEGDEVVLYVSPSGNDGDRGTREHPFATLERARDAVRIIRSGPGGERKEIAVHLRGGVYMLERPFVLRAGDGGTAGHTVTYAAEEGESPVLSGGALIRDWEETELNGHRVWKGVVHSSGESPFDVHELWVNGRRSLQSRYPHKGYLGVESVPGVTSQTDWLEGETAFCVAGQDIPPGESFTGAEAVVMNRWVESRLPVTGFDPDSNLFRFGRRSMFRLEKGDPLYFVNVRSALQEPGDWFADRNRGVIYYVPRPGEATGSVESFVPRLTTILRIEGSPDSGRFVSHVTFRGISFSHAGWYFPPVTDSHRIEPGGFPQAATGVPAAVVARGARSCSFEGCSFSHLGTYALEFGEGCRENVVRLCDLFDLGAGGIRIGETVIRQKAEQRTSENSVVDCRIYDGGKVFHSAIGVWIGQSGMNRIIHNQIHDFYYSGISIGWTWGYGPALAQGNVVAMNHVHHIGVLSDGDGPVLSDMGGIYTLGNQEGTVIRNNIFHDIAAFRYGGWGIYFDEGTTHIAAEGNLVYRTTHGGFHQHYGRENRFRNNIIAFGRDLQVQRTRLENHTSFAFEHNIVLWDGGQFLGGNSSGGNMVFDHNLYWYEGKDPLRFDTLTFAGWQLRGNDNHSAVADPGFQDPRSGDFRFRNPSAAGALGFVPIPFEKILSDVPLGEGGGTLQAPRRRRTLYNSDGSNIFWRRSFSRDDVYGCVDEVADAGVTTFLFNPNPCQNVVYPGGTAGMFSYDFPRTPGYIPTERDSMYRHFSENLQTLLKDTLDPAGMIVDRARLRGMEAFLTVRMNELHDVDRPGSPLLGEFWKSHPGYRVGGYDGWGAFALNYAEPAVREYYFAILSELCERYPIDGLELDFMRFPYYFPRDSATMSSYAGTMTQFVERVRRMTRETGRRRGIPIIFAVRVPSSLKSCAYIGLDPAGWCARGLVDILTVAPFLSTEPDMHLREFRESCRDVPLYACFEYTCGERMMTVEEIRGASALYFAAGADGVYSFNYFCSRAAGQEPAFSVFHEIGDPAALTRMDKVYTLSAAKYPVPGVSLSPPLPVRVRKGRPQTVTLGTSEPVMPAWVTLRIECAGSIREGSLGVAFNGVRLGRGAHPATPLVVQRKVLYDPPPVSHALEYGVDPRSLRDVNRITLSSGADVSVKWIYLTVNH
jgi:hypothetical protein